MTCGLSANNSSRDMRKRGLMSETAFRLSAVLAPTPVVHAHRFSAVCWAVESLVTGARLSVTGIGRGGRGATKHAIKRADRLVSNQRLFDDHSLFFGAIAKTILPARGAVRVLVDWTRVGEAHYALVAAVPADGRALPLMFELHALRDHGRPSVEEAFLIRLRALLAGRKVVVVTDAGFRTDWFRACERLGLDYVGRLTGYANVGVSGRWRKGRELAEGAGEVYRDLGITKVTKARQHRARVVVAAKPKIRPRRSRKKSKRHGDASVKKARKAAKQAWVLVTSLDCPAKMVLNLYGLRMQIEESFRDTKSPRFGRSLRFSRSEGILRLANLLLLDCLAALVLMLVGLKAERMQLQRSFQANSVRRHRVLSLARLAREVLATPMRRYFGAASLRREAYRLRAAVVCGDW